jgi:arsenate reductase
MAEGFARALGKGLMEPYSAGLIAAGVNKRAISVMKEIGIDISGQKSEEITDLLKTMDVIITLCAMQRIMHTHHRRSNACWPVDDPSVRWHRGRDQKEFRRARDEIKGKIEDFIQQIKKGDMTQRCIHEKANMPKKSING